MRIALDTNVVSELLRPRPSKAVSSWMREHGEDTCLTSITRAELRYGVARLPRGERKNRLTRLVESVLEEFASDTLPFDAAAADAYGELTAMRERTGRTKSVSDTMIAAICLATGSGLATPNVADFDDAGLTVLVDPFHP